MVDFAKKFEEDQALKDYIARLPVNAVDPETGFTNYTNPLIPELKLPVEGIHPDYIPSRYDVAGPVRLFPAVHKGNENVKHIIKEGVDFNRLFGTNGAERAQTWPEKMVRSGFNLPVDVMEGRVLTGPGLRPGDYSDDPDAPHPLSELFNRTQDLAGMAAGGSVASTGLKAEAPGALSRLATKLKERLNEDNEVGTAVTANRIVPTINEVNNINKDIKTVNNFADKNDVYLYVNKNSDGSFRLDRLERNGEIKGVGKEVLDKLHEIADKYQKPIYLRATSGLKTNEKLVDYYKKNGYEIINTPENLARKQGTEMVRNPNLLEDNEVGTALSATKNSFANRLNEHITGNQTMPEILAKQRASEGYEAAIRDSETKKVTTGMWHEEVIDKIAKERGISREEVNNLVSSPEKGNLVKGYINDRGQFISEAALERRQQARANSKTAMFRSDDEVGTGIAGVENSYRGQHTSPNAESGSPAHNVSLNSYPDDFYSSDGPRYYGTGNDRMDYQTWQTINSMKDKPNAKVKIYRAIPNDLTNADKLAILEKQMANYMKRGTLPEGEGKGWYDKAYEQREQLRNAPKQEVSKIEVNPGDWVSINREYVKEHGESTLKGNYKIISKTVPAKELFTNGDSMHEWGWHPTLRSDDIVGTGIASAANSMAPKFYSALERSVANSKSNKASPEQWLGPKTERTYIDKNTGKEVHEVKYSGMLGNTPGITVEELEHLKLPEWIDEQKQAGKKSISKEEIQNYINDNKVELNETWKGDIKDKKYHDDLDKISIEKYGLPYDHVMSSQQNEIRKEALSNQGISGPTRFAQYQLPGGSNYRELLLSLKDTPSKLKRVQEINDELSNIRKRMPDNLNNPEAKKLYDRQNELGTERQDLEMAFTTDHWPGAKDIVVHSRMNDRFIPDENGPLTTIKSNSSNELSNQLLNEMGLSREQFEKQNKGLNSLHVEEVQSDLHQKGNSEGYRLSLKEKNKLEPEFNRIEEKIVNSGDEQVMSNPEIKDAVKLAVDKKIITQAEAKTYLRYADSERLGAVKDAPFKNTWSDLMIKRLIRQAAEEGKDAISWTPGQAQADRYQLSKQISHIEYEKAHDGKYEIQAYDKNNNRVLHEDEVPIERIRELVGKELAEKIKNEVGEKTGGAYRDWRKISGLDLDVGGEFHKKFYDEIMLNKVNAIAKKFGGRVEFTRIAVPHKNGIQGAVYENVPFLRLTPELKKHALEKGFSLFESGLPLVPVDHDPFQTKKHKLIPVPHNPFE